MTKLFLFVALMTSVPANTTLTAADATAPPVAKKAPKTDVVHGERRTDDYFWLRDKANPDGRRLPGGRERLHRRGDGEDGRPFQEALYKEMLGAHQGDGRGGAVPEGRLLLLLADRGGQAVPDLLPEGGRPGSAGAGHPRPERARGRQEVHGARRLRGQRRRDQARLLDRRHRLPPVHAVRQGPRRRATTGPKVAEKVGSAAWAADGKTLFYTVEEEQTKRQYQLYRHALGLRRSTTSSTRRRTRRSTSASTARAA